MSLPCFLRMSWKYTILFTKDQVCLRLSLHIGLNLICSPSYLYVIPLPRRPGFGLNDLYWGKGWSDFGCFFPFPISKLSSSDLGDCGEKQGRQRSVEIIGHLLALVRQPRSQSSSSGFYLLFWYNCLHGDSVHGSLEKDFSSQLPQLLRSLKEGQPCLPLVSLE